MVISDYENTFEYENTADPHASVDFDRYKCFHDNLLWCFLFFLLVFWRTLKVATAAGRANVRGANLARSCFSEAEIWDTFV